MDGSEIAIRVKQLNLPEGEFIVFGSCPLALAGIRLAKDIDMLVTPKVLEALADIGWQQIHKGPKDDPYTFDIFEAHPNWDFSPYSPTLIQLLDTATYVNGIPFASLAEVRRWKLATGGEKHVADVARIDMYLKDAKGL